MARVAAARKLAEICWKRPLRWHPDHPEGPPTGTPGRLVGGNGGALAVARSGPQNASGATDGRHRYYEWVSFAG